MIIFMRCEDCSHQDRHEVRGAFSHSGKCPKCKSGRVLLSIGNGKVPEWWKP